MGLIVTFQGLRCGRQACLGAIYEKPQTAFIIIALRYYSSMTANPILADNQEILKYFGYP